MRVESRGSPQVLSEVYNVDMLTRALLTLVHYNRLLVSSIQRFHCID